MMDKSFAERFIELQSKIRVDKTQTAKVFTKNGKNFEYQYRSKEDIFQAVRDLLKDYHMILYTSNTVVTENNRSFIKCTARVTDLKESIESESVIELSDIHDPQETAKCISFAEKYALCSLFLISGGADPDDLNRDNAKAASAHMADNIPIIPTAQNDEELTEIKIKSYLQAWKKQVLDKALNLRDDQLALLRRIWLTIPKYDRSASDGDIKKALIDCCIFYKIPY